MSMESQFAQASSISDLEETMGLDNTEFINSIEGRDNEVKSENAGLQGHTQEVQNTEFLPQNDLGNDIQ